MANTLSRFILSAVVSLSVACGGGGSSTSTGNGNANPPSGTTPPPNNLPNPPGGGGAGAEELRCQALGTVCACSEPLTSTGFTRGAESPAGSGKVWLNPSDASTKQCGQTSGFSWYYDDVLFINTSAAMPAGSTVQTVWRDTNNGGGAAGNASALTGSPVRATTKKLCVRHYVKFSSDYDAFAAGGCWANKQAMFPYYNGYTRQALVQLSDGQNYGNIQLWARYWDDLVNPSGGEWLPQTEVNGGADVDDCRGTWCRQEICLYATGYNDAQPPAAVSTDVATGRGLWAIGYTQVAQSTRRTTYGPYYLGNSTGGTLVSPEIYSGYREGTCDGYREISHAMQAEWDTNPGVDVWIGAASEIEGTP